MLFKIIRWDAVIPEHNTFPMPMIYIKPLIASEFDEYAKKNEYQILVEIKDTNSGYDGKKLVGVINPSDTFPSYRPNFYNKEGLWTITLFSEWKGYPLTLGNALIRGTEGSDKIINTPSTFEGITRPFPTMLQNYTENYSEKKCGFSSRQLILMVVFFVLIFTILVVMKTRRN